MSDAGDDNIIHISGTEHQLHQIELPTGATVVGMGVVFVRLDGDVSAVLRCQGRDRRDRQAFFNVMSIALDDFREKHGLAVDGGSIRTRRT